MGQLDWIINQYNQYILTSPILSVLCAESQTPVSHSVCLSIGPPAPHAARMQLERALSLSVYPSEPPWKQTRRPRVPIPLTRVSIETNGMQSDPFGTLTQDLHCSNGYHLGANRIQSVLLGTHTKDLHSSNDCWLGAPVSAAHGSLRCRCL
jgi:hypothetical protein